MGVGKKNPTGEAKGHRATSKLFFYYYYFLPAGKSSRACRRGGGGGGGGKQSLIPPLLALPCCGGGGKKKPHRLPKYLLSLPTPARSGCVAFLLRNAAFLPPQKKHPPPQPTPRFGFSIKPPKNQLDRGGGVDGWRRAANKRPRPPRSSRQRKPRSCLRYACLALIYFFWGGKRSILNSGGGDGEKKKNRRFANSAWLLTGPTRQCPRLAAEKSQFDVITL